MSEWKAKRFWKEVHVEAQEDGFSILLDTRAVKTPAKQSLMVPSRGFADAIAAEWRAQEEMIDPLSMPFTRSANAALDKVAVQQAEVADMLAAYGDSDLLCYRAEHPQRLADRQAENWDPVLEWAAKTYGARLHSHAGVMHVPQEADALERLSREVHGLNIFQLAGFHDLVSLSGSLILGLAATRDAWPIEELWQLSRLDEIWQSEEWGKDEEAEAMAEIKRTAFIHAKQVFDLSTI